MYNIKDIDLKSSNIFSEFLQLFSNLLGVSVSDGVARVALPTLGTVSHSGPALRTDQVLLSTTEDLSHRSLQTNWTL